MHFIQMGDEERKATGQSLLEARKYARSLEGLMDTLLPLVDDVTTAGHMKEVRDKAIELSGILMTIYQNTARELLAR